MKHINIVCQKSIFLLSCIFLLTGCSNNKDIIQDKHPSESVPATQPPLILTEIPSSESPKVDTAIEPTIVNIDWSDYFDGLNGAAVFYNSFEDQYMIYNQALATVQRSPCSTFKIISSLIGLEKGIIPSENSTRKWSGEIFWNKNWNKDIDFNEAFYTSCIWYFREVINELGQDIIQEELDKLQYGNCDISDWEGLLNTNNNNRSLTGFWVESSLKISAKEQVEVMNRIFDGIVSYNPKTLNQLKEAMLITDQNNTENHIYGKTGLGKTDGIVVDSWFAGFIDTSKGNIYFCVYLGQTDGMNVSSARAKEIALEIASDYKSKK